MKYKVTIDYTVTGSADFEVEADGKDEAADKAVIAGDDYTWDSIRNGDSSEPDIECVDVMEMKIKFSEAEMGNRDGVIKSMGREKS